MWIVEVQEVLEVLPIFNLDTPNEGGCQHDEKSPNGAHKNQENND
jgi:hypothetical protein